MGEIALHEIKALTKLKGVGVLKFLGVVIDPPKLMIVTEIYNLSSMHDFIRDERYNDLSVKDRIVSPLHSSPPPLPLPHSTVPLNY